jgi:hypothetical protein
MCLTNYYKLQSAKRKEGREEKWKEGRRRERKGGRTEGKK